MKVSYRNNHPSLKGSLIIEDERWPRGFCIIVNVDDKEISIGASDDHIGEAGEFSFEDRFSLISILNRWKAGRGSPCDYVDGCWRCKTAVGRCMCNRYSGPLPQGCPIHGAEG